MVPIRSLRLNQRNFILSGPKRFNCELEVFSILDRSSIDQLLISGADEWRIQT